MKTFFYPFFPYSGETSAWSGTCAKFNPRNLALLKRHARLWGASFGWHVLQRKSYTRPSYAPKKLEPKAKALQVLAQKPFAQKPPKVRVSAIALLTQLANGGRLQRVPNGCKRLQTVANGCEHKSRVERTQVHPETQLPTQNQGTQNHAYILTTPARYNNIQRQTISLFIYGIAIANVGLRATRISTVQIAETDNSTAKT